MQPSSDICRLIEIMAALRTPDTGCPWDIQQTHRTLAPYALEEAYEVVEAIERNDMENLREELGDLLLQVVFHARVAEEAGAFRFGDIVEGVTSKMVRRHPHVFSEPVEKPQPKSGVDKIWDAMRMRRMERLGQVEPVSAGGGLMAAMAAAEDKAVFSNKTWESIKAEERKLKGKGSQIPAVGLLSEVANGLPGLTRAVKLQKKASTVGFDWGDARLVLAKIREEIDEIEDAMDKGESDGRADRVEGEIGDLIFAVANLARHAGVDPEGAVRATNRKFEQRFAYIEKELSLRGSSPETATLDEMDALWNQAKSAGL